MLSIQLGAVQAGVCPFFTRHGAGVKLKRLAERGINAVARRGLLSAGGYGKMTQNGPALGRGSERRGGRDG